MNARADLPSALLAASEPELRPTFEPFNWATLTAFEASKLNQLEGICAARDVTSGVAEILAMLERDEIDAGCEDGHGRPIRRLFGSDVRGNLQRLAITSLRMLADRMDIAIDRANCSAEERTSG